MAFRAVHAQWGPVFAHLPGLGCGQAWEAVWKVRPSAPLGCDECRHPMYAKTSRNGLRFFAHAPGAPNCALALETLAHHMLKLELLKAAQDAGAHAEMEVRGPDGTWRADVMAAGHGGTWRMALEAQLSPVTAADITARTERMRADGVTSIWFSDRPRPPWLGVVPSARLARRDDGQLAVAEGLMKFSLGPFCGLVIAGRAVKLGSWEPVPASLPQFLGWAFKDRIVPHKLRPGLEQPALFWTAPDYIQAEAEHSAELQRLLERERQPRARQWTREQIAAIRIRVRSDAAAAEQTARRTRAAGAAAWCERTAQRPDVARVIALLARKYDVTATVGWSIGDPRYADGIPLFGSDGELAAILGPDPQRIRRENYALLAGTLLLFSSKDRHAFFNRAMKGYEPKPLDGWQTDFIDG